MGTPEFLGAAQTHFKTREKIFFGNLASSLVNRPFPIVLVTGKDKHLLSVSAGKGVSVVDSQYQFDAYCKKVLRNATRDIFKQLMRRAEREVSLSDLPDAAAVMDEYFAAEKQFDALGFSIAIRLLNISAAT